MFRFPLQRKYNWSNNDQCCTNWRLSEKHKLVKLNGHVTYMRALCSYLRYTLFRSKTCRMLSFSDGEMGSHTWHDVNQLSRNLGAALYICHIGTGRSFHGYSIEIYEVLHSLSLLLQFLSICMTFLSGDKFNFQFHGNFHRYNSDILWKFYRKLTEVPFQVYGNYMAVTWT